MAALFTLGQIVPTPPSALLVYEMGGPANPLLGQAVNDWRDMDDGDKSKTSNPTIKERIANQGSGSRSAPQQAARPTGWAADLWSRRSSRHCFPCMTNCR
jgi:hypothetical protein